MEISDRTIESLLAELFGRERKCEEKTPLLFLFAEDPELISADERKEIETHLGTCRYCQMALREVKQAIGEESVLEASPTCREILDQRKHVKVAAMSVSVAGILAHLFVSKRMKLKPMNHRGAETTSMEDGDWELDTLMTATGRRDGDHAILLEESGKHPENVQKLIRTIRKINEIHTKKGAPRHLHGTVILAKDQTGKWHEIERQKGMAVPVKVRDEKESHACFILIFGPAAKIQKSVEKIVTALNGGEETKQVSKTVVAVIVDL